MPLCPAPGVVRVGCGRSGRADPPGGLAAHPRRARRRPDAVAICRRTQLVAPGRAAGCRSRARQSGTADQREDFPVAATQAAEGHGDSVSLDDESSGVGRPGANRGARTADPVAQPRLPGRRATLVRKRPPGDTQQPAKLMPGTEELRPSAPHHQERLGDRVLSRIRVSTGPGVAGDSIEVELIQLAKSCLVRIQARLQYRFLPVILEVAGPSLLITRPIANIGARCRNWRSHRRDAACADGTVTSATPSAFGNP